LSTLAKDNKEQNEVEEKPRETPVEFLASLAAVLARALDSRRAEFRH